MLRTIAIGAVAMSLLGSLQAHAQQEVIPPLAGGPGSRPSQDADLKSEQARLARQAEAQKAEQTRLARQAQDLAAREARLKVREAELAAEEKRLTELEANLKADGAATLADLIRETDSAREEAALRRAQPEEDASAPGDIEDAETPARPLEYAGIDFERAERACARAGEDAAQARNFYSARYDSEPRLQRNGGWQLFGWMRLMDRRGYIVVRTVCALDESGGVQHFAILR
jgi:hypothetical protein